MKYSKGDKVVVRTSKGEFSGVVMPSKDKLVIKLESGYNIGVDKDNVKNVKLVEKAKESERKEKKVRHRKGLPTVSILSTGGTISSRIDYETGAVHSSISAADLMEMVPELRDVANIRCREVMNRMSEDMEPADWSEIAEQVAEELEDEEVAGVVVTHGTDTMHYTSAALSFMLDNLGKPVVLTGSQRSSDRGSSDARMNLLCSAIAATSDIAEVCVCMHGTTEDAFCHLHRGTKVRKMHTSRRDAFQSINAQPIAKVFPDNRIEVISNHRKRSDSEVRVRSRMEERVGLIYVRPGMEAREVEWYIKKKYKGIVLMGTGLGHVPQNIVKTINKAVKKGIMVCIAPQCIHGRLNLNVYSNGRRLLEAGATPLGDILPETAYVKLMWALGQKNAEDIMKEDIAGEFSKRSKMEDLGFSD